MGAFLDKPKIDKQNEDGKGNELEYAVSSMQGWRVDMEDSHTAALSIKQLPKWSFFAVFDGHAGSRVAEHSSKHLLDEIMSQEKIQEIVENVNNGRNTVENHEFVEEAIKKAFLNLDHKMRGLSDTKDGFDRSGSTSVCVLISPTHYYFINCGDSRALLCRKGKVTFATADHKPNNPKEKERIVNAGGSVMIQRVNGSLAVSRALGDYEYKNVNSKGPTEQLVSPEPDVTKIPRVNKEDEFLILACDGIFDVSTNEELSDYVSSRLAITDNFTEICNDVVDMSLNKGSRDNMTMVLLGLPAVPKPSEKAKAAESKLNEQLRSMMKNICEEAKNSTQPDSMEFSYALQSLMNQEEKIEGLPPGGGIYAKRSFLEKVYKEFFPEDDLRNSSDGSHLLDDNNFSTPASEHEPGV